MKNGFLKARVHHLFVAIGLELPLVEHHYHGRIGEGDLVVQVLSWRLRAGWKTGVAISRCIADDVQFSYSDGEAVTDGEIWESGVGVADM